jgi:hypothetical protein
MSDHHAMSDPRLRPPDWVLALLFYTILAIGLTWPLVLRFTTDIPGGFHKDGLEDAYQNVWNLWWTVEALSRPTNLWVTDRFFFPEQPNLLYHTLSPVNTVLVAPITALWGPIAGFNAVALLSFIIGGMGMWLLARERVGAGPALLAGVVYIASPFHTAALITDGQLQIFAHHWLPWYALFLLRALKPKRETGGTFGGRFCADTPHPPSPPIPLPERERSFEQHQDNEAPAAPPAPRVGAGHREKDDRPSSFIPRLSSFILAGFFLALIAYGDWYYTLFMLFFTACAGLWAIWRARASGWPAAGAVVARLAGVGAIFTILVLPIVAPMLREAARADYMNLYPADDPLRLSADLIAYLVPHRHHSLWGSAPWDWGVSYGVNRRFFVGITVTLLALLALWRYPAARPWGVLVLGAGILSLGAELQFNGVRTGIPLPWALLADLPIVRLTRQPDRLNVLVTIGLGMLAAYGAAGNVPIIGTQRAASLRAHIVILVVLIILEYLPAPLTTRVPPIPPFLAGLPAEPAGALVEYPFHIDVPYRDAERMLFQTVHERPISGGYHSRLYPQPQLGLPALRDLRAGALWSDIVREPGGWTPALNTLGFSHIIGYKQQPLGPISLQPADEAPFKAFVEAGLNVDAPIYEDEWLIAYAVPTTEPAPVIGIREGWGPVEMPEPNVRHRWLSASGAIGLHTPTAGNYRLSFTALPAGGPRTLRVHLPTTSHTLALASGPHRYSLLLTLPAGTTILHLSSVEPPTSGDELEGNGDLRLISIRFADFHLVALP